MNSRTQWWSTFRCVGKGGLRSTRPPTVSPATAPICSASGMPTTSCGSTSASAIHYHAAGLIRTLVLGVPTRECHAWGAPIHSVFDGEIVQAVDRFPERSWVHPVRELALVIKNGLTFTPARLPSLLGNHVIARREDLVAVFAHLAPGSVTVQGRPGRSDRRGHRSRGTHGELDDPAPPFPAHGHHRPERGAWGRLRVQDVRSAPRGHVAPGAERDPRRRRSDPRDRAKGPGRGPTTMIEAWMRPPSSG